MSIDRAQKLLVDIHGRVDELLSADNYAAVDELLRNIDVAQISRREAYTYLAATFMAKPYLTERAAFHERAIEQFGNLEHFRNIR